MNKKYIIAAMATSFALNMNAQSVKVTGNVVDSNNEPVIGAYIKVKGSNRGAVTDLDGHYAIDADKNATLVISYVGMANQEEKVGNRSQINFVLKDDANDLNEVVVIGYGQVKKGDLTSSISAIKGDKLEKLSTGNVMNALQGQVNGVQISCMYFIVLCVTFMQIVFTLFPIDFILLVSLCARICFSIFGVRKNLITTI